MEIMVLLVSFFLVRNCHHVNGFSEPDQINIDNHSLENSLITRLVRYGFYHDKQSNDIFSLVARLGS